MHQFLIETGYFFSSLNLMAKSYIQSDAFYYEVVITVHITHPLSLKESKFSFINILLTRLTIDNAKGKNAWMAGRQD